MDDDLVAWGRVAYLETHGRRTGRLRRVAVGYVQEADGAVLVAAGGPDTQWALNLRAEPRCRVTIGGETTAWAAEELEGADAARAVRELILRYGTPAESLGNGPVFRLVTTEPSPPA